MLIGVPYDALASVWDDARPLIEKALAEGTGDYTLANIHAALADRSMQLWLWIKDERPTAALVTTLVNYPTRRVALMLLAGGDGLAEWKDDPTIKNWAKANGCAALEVFGRKGWERVLMGFEPVSVQYRRAI